MFPSNFRKKVYKTDKVMYDRSCLDAKTPSIPEWMASEPKKVRNFGLYLRQMAEAKVKKGDPESDGKKFATLVKETVEKMKKKPEKCRRKFEEHQKLEEKAYDMWYDGLNDFQKELLEEHRAVSLLIFINEAWK